jgi:hypothetical protein
MKLTLELDAEVERPQRDEIQKVLDNCRDEIKVILRIA